MNVKDILNKEEFSKEEIVFLLSLTGQEDIDFLFKKANQVRHQFVGDEVHLRGVIGFSNFCEENCIYCGLREDNFSLPRYRMNPDEIINTAKIIANEGIYTIMLQSGVDSFYDADMISYIIYSIKQNANIAVTLSIGERRFDEYKAWRIAGADRYMLKHETANEKHYFAYHDKKNLNDRVSHLRYLKQIGYQVASGSLIGLPLQTVEDIADDILLCKELDVDMAAFGPFVPAPFTPYKTQKAGNIDMSLKTIAVTRIVLKDVHIPASSALDTIDKEGREKGLRCGANVVMPDFTPHPYREQYVIYPGRAGISEDPLATHKNIQARIEAIGRKVSASRGDSLKKSISIS
jgi:biotin synthase